MPLTARSAPLRRSTRVACGHAASVRPRDVVGLSEQRSEDAHDAQEDDDPDDDDGDQKEDQEPKATAVTLSHYDHLWRWWVVWPIAESRHVLTGRRAEVPFVAGWRAT